MANRYYLPKNYKPIKDYLGQLYHNPDFRPQNMSPHNQLPFTSAEVLQGLRKLPRMKALAPPCMPALIWHQLASELAEPIFRALEYHWCGEVIDPPYAWLRRSLIPRLLG